MVLSRNFKFIKKKKVYFISSIFIIPHTITFIFFTEYSTTSKSAL